MRDFEVVEGGSSLARSNDRDPAEIKKRSVVIAGHRTSISLENLFWDTLRSIADDAGVSVNHLVGQIDHERSGNLSSAIRIFVLEALLAKQRSNIRV